MLSSSESCHRVAAVFLIPGGYQHPFITDKSERIELEILIANFFQHIRSSFVYQCQNYNIHLTTRNMIAKINTNCTVDVLSLADFADAQIL